MQGVNSPLSPERPMPHRLPRLARVAALLSALALAPITVATAATAAMHAEPAATAAPAAAGAAVPDAAPGAAASGPLLLVNGDAVTAPQRGPGVITPFGHGLAGSVLRLSVAGKSYAIPAAAVPYLGRGMTPSLFEMSLLARRERAGRLPVEVGYTGRVPQLPGITITSSGDGIADGYLTAASARA